MCCTANMKTLHPFKKFLISSPVKENRLARCIPSVADMGSSNEVDIGTLGFCSTREKETHDTNKNIMGQLRPIWAYILKASLETPTLFPQENLNFPQICPKMPQNDPKMNQSGPNMTPYGPRMIQSGPKMTQNYPQMAQK